MSKSSEEVLLIVKNVRNKKTDGTLYMMGERMAWMLESRDVFNISYLYADIKAQKISPETKEKVQLQVILHDNSANTFLFTNPAGRTSQKQDREAVKELLQQLLPRFKRKISSELEEKNRVLQQNPEAFQLYKDLVVSGVVTPEEFWSSRSHSDIKPQTDGANGRKYNLTTDIIQSIFKTYPMVKKKHAEVVPDQISESEFWTRFFQSHYFHRDRHILASKDIFTDCAKKDEEVMKDEINKNVNDPLVDLLNIKDQAVDEEYRGIIDDSRASQNQANQAMIRRFNQHSTMVLRVCDASSQPETSAVSNGTNGTTGHSDQEGVKKSQKSKHLNGTVSLGVSSSSKTDEFRPAPIEPHRKKRRIKEKLQYEDLEKDGKSEGVSLRLSHMDRYLAGPAPTCGGTSMSGLPSAGAGDAGDSVSTEGAVNALAQEVATWGSDRRQVLNGGQALAALGKLSPGGALMSGTSLQKLHKQVSPATREEIRQTYSAMLELLRHFWACFPVMSKALEDKVTRMRVTLERFEMSKLGPLKERMAQQHYALNLTIHLEEMLRAAYLKFDSWQARRNARRT
ncbi:hypothetical protein EGW08_016253 [Elysia chlorotica]|uniref:BSD domain-containing protein n=1 Tax=Elysia chlorotica TaxID=188477 RepID=A0A433T372_ELYCH|nr:hypothetical protein EGW08_016253 [Elysia chlorotica]